MSPANLNYSCRCLEKKNIKGVRLRQRREANKMIVGEEGLKCIDGKGWGESRKLVEVERIEQKRI